MNTKIKMNQILSFAFTEYTAGDIPKTCDGSDSTKYNVLTIFIYCCM